MRKPLGPTAMDRTVRFRLTDQDLAMLREISGDESLSVIIRRLISDEHARQKRNGDAIS